MMYRKTNHKSRAVKPADRLLFIMGLAALGITLIIRLGTGRTAKIETPVPPEPLRLVISIGEALESTHLKTLIGAYLQDVQAGAPAEINIEVDNAAAGPDIIITQGHLLAGDIAKGRYLVLDPYLHSESAWGGWALPLVSAMDVLVYNIPLLQEAGFDRPPRTRTEFLRYARALKETGRYALALGLNPADSRAVERDLFSWIYASGLSLVREGKPEFTGRSYTAALDFFSQLNQEELLAPGTFSASGAQRIEDLAQGRAAMMVASVKDLRQLREKMGEEAIGITLIPPADDYPGRPVFGLCTWYAGIGAESPHPGEAWELLRYLEEHRAILAETLALVPGSGSVAPYIAVDPLLDKAWDMYEAADTVQDFFSLARAEELEAAFHREVEIMFRESRSAEDSAAAINERWTTSWK
jgi:ABC-type glycerol-3-phosphate transport system substrate-binding protein